MLQALWLALLFLAGGRPRTQAISWRANAVSYLDEHGNQSDGAKAYRREETFPEMR